MRICTWTLIVAGLALIDAQTSGATDTIDFNRDVRPILSNNCFQCHGPDQNYREAELRLDVEADVKEARDDYFIIKIHEPSKSELFQRIISEDEDSRMPPVDSGKELTATQIETIKKWIEQGAPWNRHWAYVLPKWSPVPTISNDLAKQNSNWIDHFLQHRLRQENLDFSAETDRNTLVRRIHFDLIGLPPQPEDVKRFTQDQRSDAYERLVNRLLASPQFGERMAIYWLDLVRFADTVGYHGDQDHSITPYRDYVIDAFNDNKPFDQFTREQLAGDLLPNATIEQKIATGYNRLLQTSHEGGVQPKEYLTIYAADRVRNVSAVWMGATLGCAQCHDHKYDPYTSRDFYSMSAFFADVDEEQHFKLGSNDLPTARPPELEVTNRVIRKRLQDLNKRLTSFANDADAASRLQEKIRQLNAARRKTMVTVALSKPRTIRVLPRGNWLDDSGDVVDPAAPKFLSAIDSESRLNRFDLANWLTDSQASGLLTARVFVNRMWYLFFGHGISPSLDDFGGQGQPPEHPQLLDNLAIEFVRSGWDVKYLVRFIVTSRAYRQSSLETEELRQKDPDNQLVARQTRFRLPAEMIRDNALSISGLLVHQIGGASAKPHQPRGYYRHLNFPQRKYKADQNSQQFRRGVYVHWQRQFLHPMMKAFDAPSREECTAQRPRSNTPLAALTMLNDPSFVEAAAGFANRIQQLSTASDQEKIRFAFQLATSRNPDRFELETLHSLLKHSQAHYKNHPEEAQQFVQQLSLEPDQQESVANVNSRASWTTVARAVLNLSETITRN